MSPERPERAGAPVRATDRLPVIAIDGPGGAGKSTVARHVAARAGFLYLDTGAMYRAVTRAVLDAQIPAPDGALDPAAVTAVAETADIEFRRDGLSQHVLLNGEDVTAAIRQADIEGLVARVACLPGVRRALVPQQRRLARRGGVVVDGRDIGTAVLPDADCKFFITADFSVRVDRRYQELCGTTSDVDRGRVEADLHERDRLDATRAEGALRRAADAVVIDTTDLTIEQAVQSVLAACSLPGLAGTGGVAAGATVGTAADKADAP